MPGNVKLRYTSGGETRETGVGSMQSASLSTSEKSVHVVVVDDKGAELAKGAVDSGHFWIVGPGSKSAATLTQAGEQDSAHALRNEVQFYNTANYNVSVVFITMAEEQSGLDEVPVPSHGVSAVTNLDEGTWRASLKDEGGNPIGKVYAFVKPGHFYVIYRKRDTLYDLTQLGTLTKSP